VVVKTAISRETCKWQRHYGSLPPSLLSPSHHYHFLQLYSTNKLQESYMFIGTTLDFHYNDCISEISKDSF